MLGISGLPALDVAIGLAFLFFLLSTAIAAINELLASYLGWRAKTLEEAIANLLGERENAVVTTEGKPAALPGLVPPPPAPAQPAGSAQPSPLKTLLNPKAKLSANLLDAVMSHPRVASLVQDPTAPQRRKSRPSYLPGTVLSRAVAAALAAKDPQAPEANDPTKTVWQRTDEQVMQSIDKAIADLRLTNTGAQGVLVRAADLAGGKLETFRVHVENAFDDAMERASGWYKRRVQAVTLVIAILITCFANIDSAHIAANLWKDDTVRTAVAAQASAEDNESPASIGEVVDGVEELDLPIGWTGGNAPDDVGEFIFHIPGWLITIAALSLGAPFWFDALSRLARLRGSGVSEKPRALSDTAGRSDTEGVTAPAAQAAAVAAATAAAMAASGGGQTGKADAQGPGPDPGPPQ